MAFILTRPAILPSGITEMIRNDIVIPTGGTAIGDSLSHVHNIAAKWIVTLSDPTFFSKISSFEILAVHRDGTPPFFNRYAVVGDIISMAVDVQLVGTEMQLLITNNEDFDLLLNVVRIQTIT